MQRRIERWLRSTEGGPKKLHWSADKAANSRRRKRLRWLC
jgi:hypothetical protein